LPTTFLSLVKNFIEKRNYMKENFEMQKKTRREEFKIPKDFPKKKLPLIT